MAAIAELRLSIIVRDANGAVTEAEPDRVFRWTPGSLLPQRQVISLTAETFQALTAPSGAKYVYIDPGAAESLVLKGVTGDSGVSLTPSSNPMRGPILLPISSPTFGIYNGDSAAWSITVVWL